MKAVNGRGFGRLVFAGWLVIAGFALLRATPGFVDIKHDGPRPRFDNLASLAQCADELSSLKWGVGYASLDRCTTAKEVELSEQAAAFNATARTEWDFAFVLAWILLLAINVAIAFGLRRLASWVAAGFAHKTPMAP